MKYNLEQIKKILPHRDPFLFLDEILEVNEDEGSIVASKTFNEDLDIFKGHFPNLPITPGVIILEALAQAGAFLALSKEEYIGKIAYFIGADDVKWKSPVLPNDTVILKVKVIKFRHGIGLAQGEAYVNDELACSATLKVAVK